MESIVDSLRLGWNALLLREEPYERMRYVANPVAKGLVLILVVGVTVALLGFVGNLLEWATSPDMRAIQETVYDHLSRMPWWQMANRDPQFQRLFDMWYEMGWGISRVLGSPNLGFAAADIVLTPLGLVARWLIYGLLAYLFARALGGTATISETLGVLALAVAPQALNVLTLLPYVGVGGLIAIWGVLCAYLGLKTAHNLSWYRAMWATLLPFILALAVLLFASCLVSAIVAVAVRGG